MMLDTKILVPMTEANQNFSKITRLVDETGVAVILKNNKPRYVVVDFTEYDEIKMARGNLIDDAANKLINENLVAFKELAK